MLPASRVPTKFSRTYGGRGIFIFPVQLTTSRIGNLTRLIHTLLYVMTIHTYIHIHTYPPEGHQIGARKRRTPDNTILNQPYCRRVSTDRPNREGNQLAASLEGEPGPTPAGKTLSHSYPETRFRRERARDVYTFMKTGYLTKNLLWREGSCVHSHGVAKCCCWC